MNVGAVIVLAAVLLADAAVWLVTYRRSPDSSRSWRVIEANISVIITNVAIEVILVSMLVLKVAW